MPYYLISEIIAPVFEMLAIATLLVGGITGVVDWPVVALAVALISFVNSVFSAGALFMADLESQAYRFRGVLQMLLLMPLELVLSPDHVVGADQGHVAVPAGRQGVAQVRAERPRGASVSALRSTRTKEEVLLLLVSLGAAGVVVTSLVRDAPSAPEEWALVWVAASLSLVALFAFWFAGAARRSLEDALRREQDLMKRVLAAVPEGMLVVGDGRVLAVNRRLRDLVGYERDELVGATAPFAFWPPEHRHEIEHCT